MKKILMGLALLSISCTVLAKPVEVFKPKEDEYFVVKQEDGTIRNCFVRRSIGVLVEINCVNPPKNEFGEEANPNDYKE